MFGRIQRDCAPVIEHEIDRSLATIWASRHLRNTGRERIGQWLEDRSELEVLERRGALRRLDALLGRRALLARLGTLTAGLRYDLAVLDFEARPLREPFDAALVRFTRASTSARTLRDAHRWRCDRADRTADLHEEEPARVFDASHNDLLPWLRLLERGSSRAARINVLTDALLQFRALRRSPEPVDAHGGRDDNRQGRLATSGLLASLEAALVCQAAPLGRGENDARERALLRLCMVHAPHQQPSAIYQASNLTLELLGRNDRGLLGRAFLPVYGAVHTLYCADTAPRVREYLVAEHAAGLPREHALEIFSTCVDALDADQPFPGHRLLALAARSGVDVPTAGPAAVRAFLVARTRAVRLARAPPERQLATWRALLALHEAVCVAEPSAASVLRDAGFAGAATPSVLRLAVALAERERGGERLAEVLTLAVRARASLARAFGATGAGMARARIWRLDHGVERVLAVALADVVRAHSSRAPTDARLRKLALRVAERAVRQSGLHLLAAAPALPHGATELADGLRRRFGERERAIHFAGVRVLLDARFTDRLVKESALHPLLELARPPGAAARKHPAQRTSGGVAVRVLAPPPAGTLRVARLKNVWPDMRLPVADALVVDERDAPPGYSHLAVRARERGVGLLAVQGLADVAWPRGPLRLQHDHLVRAPHGKARPLRERVGAPVDVQPFDVEVELAGGPPPGSRLSALARLPLAERRRHVGEKAAVLAELLADDELGRAGALAVDGAVLSFAQVAGLVADAGLLGAWMRGRAREREVRERLAARWLKAGGAVTDEGRALVRALGVRGSRRVVVRSSGSIEDRPGASAAGLFASVVGRRGAKAVLSAIAQVIASTWRPAARQFARELGVPMSRVWPAVIVQRDLGVERGCISGVAVSRGADGAFGAISYQAVRGRGAGVRGGRAEEGQVSPLEHVVTRQLPGGPLLSLVRARTLGRAVLAVERSFFIRIEPGVGHAVDVEWLWTRRGLRLVQARAFLPR